MTFCCKLLLWILIKAKMQKIQLDTFQLPYLSFYIKHTSKFHQSSNEIDAEAGTQM